MKPLDLKYRPKTLERVIGQPSAVKIIAGYLKRDSLPNCLLLGGESGCGKTSLARAIATHKEADYSEINCASARGIDMVRELLDSIRLYPMGKCRIVCLDECHALTGDAQQALLKATEEPPKNTYFILCSTSPEKVIKAIATRCSFVKINLVPEKVLIEYMGRICQKEKIDASDEVLEKVARASGGSVRSCLKILDDIRGIEEEDEKLKAISQFDPKEEAITLCRALLDFKNQWADIAKLAKNIEKDPETLRRMMLGYVTAVGWNAKGKFLQRCAHIAECLECDFYTSGKGGLFVALYKIMHP